MKVKNKSFIILSLIISTMFMSIFFIDNVKGLQESNFEYKFINNVLVDDSLIPTEINLRHNNLFTQDYNGTYSFDNDTIGNVPIGFTDTSTIPNSSIIESDFLKHNKILNLTSIDTNDVRIEQSFDNQISGIIEFWFLISDATLSNYMLFFDSTLQIITIRVISDTIIIHNGVEWIIFDTIPLDNEWYHFNMIFDCTTDKTDFYINDYYEGNHNFGNNGNNLNKIDFFNEGSAENEYSLYFDAIGYSWSTNYTIGINKYPIIEIVDSDILSQDKYEFNLNDNSNPYPKYGFPDVDFFDRESLYSFDVYPDIPRYNKYSKNINGIKISANYDAQHTGIYNDTLGIKFDNINITFGFQYKILSEINSDIFFRLYSYNNTEIIKLRFDTQSTYKTNLDYYNGIDYTNLDTIYGIDNTSKVFNFNLFINNFTVNLRTYVNNVYNNSFSFPFVFNHSGIDKLYFFAYDYTENYNYLALRLNYIGIYQQNISLCREKGYLSYFIENDWSYNIHNLFEVITNQSIKILSYYYNNQFHIYREFDNQTFFVNLHEQHVLNEGFTITNPYVYLIIKTNLNESEYLFPSIKGVRIEKFVDDILTEMDTLKFYYSNTIDRNFSFYYVNNYNRLHYQFSITQNDTQEYMLLYFDFVKDIYSSNKTIYFKGRETTPSIAYNTLMLYSDFAGGFYEYQLKGYLQSIETLLPCCIELNRFYFRSDDHNINNFTSHISRGFIYGLRIGYYPYEHIPYITLTTLSLISIMIPIIIILAPTFLIHTVYRKKGAIIPMLMFFSIITFATNLIPFQIFFVIMIALGSGLFLQYKHQKEV